MTDHSPAPPPPPPPPLAAGGAAERFIRQRPAPGIQIKRSAIIAGSAILIALGLGAALYSVQAPQPYATGDLQPNSQPTAVPPPLPKLPDDTYPLNTLPPAPRQAAAPPRTVPVPTITPEERARQEAEKERQKKAAEEADRLRKEQEEARNAPILMANAGSAAGNAGGAALNPADPNGLQAQLAASLSTLRSAQSLGAQSIAANGTATPAAADPLAVSAGTVPPDVAASGQLSKEGFAGRQAQLGNTTNSGKYQRLASPYTLRATSVIPAFLLTPINSDLPGEVSAFVSQNVYDSATGQHLLIPFGTVAQATYDSRVTNGQDGVQTVWRRLLFPNGASIELDNMPGTDAAGTVGFRDEVESHLGRKAVAVLLSSILSVGANSVANSGQTTSGVNGFNPTMSLGQAIGQQSNQVGQQLVKKDLDIPPTLKVRQGWPIRIYVNRDLILEPYLED